MAPLPCMICHNLIPNDAHSEVEKGSAHLLNIKCSAEAGCTPCTIIWTAFLRVEPKWNWRSMTDLVCEWTVAKGNTSLRLHVFEFAKSFNNDKLEVYRKTDTFYPFVGVADTIRDRCDSAEMYSKIQSWLDICGRDHGSRCQTNLTSRLPHRLIHLTRGVSRPKISLYESKQNEYGTYMALSHCWGGLSDMPLTTKENIQSRLTDIPWSELPKTFQEAVTIALELGISYLWVDALCIIQDDDNDWRQESALMGDIYSHSRLVIAADKACDSSEGLLPAAFTSEEILERRLSKDSRFEGLYIRAPFPHVYLGNREHNILEPSTWQHAKEFPLATRAWAFQEQLMATRVLHFTANEMVWECNTDCLCECGEPYVKNLSENLDKVSLKELFNPIRGPALWGDIIDAYTARKLTQQRDILPALSSTASRLQRGTYLAGLWEESLAIDLLWEVASEEGTRPMEYVAPSFSWASVVGRITTAVALRRQPPSNLTLKQLVHFIEARCQLKGSDPFGEVSSGFIRLRGKLWLVQMSFEESMWAGLNRLVYLDKVSKKPISEILTDQRFNARVDTKDDYEECLRGPVYALPVQNLHYPFVQCSGNDMFPHLALLLRRTQGGEYLRLGLLHIIYPVPLHDFEYPGEEEVTLL